MAGNKIYIPTFIADNEFNSANVLPRFFFYNGLKDILPFQFPFYMTYILLIYYPSYFLKPRVTL